METQKIKDKVHRFANKRLIDLGSSAILDQANHKKLSLVTLSEAGEAFFKDLLKLPPRKFSFTLVYAYYLEEQIMQCETQVAKHLPAYVQNNSRSDWVHRRATEKALEIAGLPEEAALRILAERTNVSKSLTAAINALNRSEADIIETKARQGANRG